MVQFVPIFLSIKTMQPFVHTFEYSKIIELEWLLSSFGSSV